MNHPNDALNNPIVIGGKYGYTTQKNGIGGVVICQPHKITDSGMVSATVLSHETYVYGEKADHPSTRARAVVSIQPWQLFPIA